MGAPEVKAPEIVADKPRCISAAQILSAADTDAPVMVDVPEWGGPVFIRVMTGVDRDRWELLAEESMKTKGAANVRASLLAATLCDESGKRLFGDGQMAALGAKSSIVVDRLFEIAQKHNKLKEDDIKELEKN